jgi:HEAT repeat protein
MLLLALADRSDAAALPAVIKAAQPGSKNLRFAAIAALERFNPVAGVPTLVEAATDNDPAIAQTAKGVLTRMPSQEVDTDLLSRLLQASGKLRQVLIEIAAQRRIDRALPSIVLASADPDAGIRAAAVNAIGLLGDNKEVGVLVKLLQRNPPTQERADLEKALVAVCGRCGSDCAAHLAPLAQSEDAALRLIAIHAFASMGGPVALAAVKNAADDKDETVQDEAVRTLSTWPSNWPEDVAVAETLLALARSGKKMSHQVLGLRGYLQFVQGDKQLKDDQKVTKIGELLPLIKRPEEKRLAINVIGTLPTASAVEWLLSLTDDPTIAEDAYAAIVTLGAKNVAGMTVEQRRQTLQSILDKSSTDATKKKAQDALNRIR